MPEYEIGTNTGGNGLKELRIVAQLLILVGVGIVFIMQTDSFLGSIYENAVQKRMLTFEAYVEESSKIKFNLFIFMFLWYALLRMNIPVFGSWYKTNRKFRIIVMDITAILAILSGCIFIYYKV